MDRLVLTIEIAKNGSFFVEMIQTRNKKITKFILKELER